ncbi:MAG: sodium:solute symporter [Candidatus Nanohaloarchaea archaeon]
MNLDQIVLISYFLLMLAIGLYYSRRHSDSESFLLANRDLGSFHVAGSSFATFTGAGLAFAAASFGYQYGISAFILLIAALIGAIVFIRFTPGIWRHSQRNTSITLPQLLDDRWDEKTKVLAALITLGLFTGSLTMQLLVAGNIANQLFGFAVKPASVGFGILVILYTLMGGFKSVTVSDLLQMLIIFAGMLLVLAPLALIRHWEAIMSLPPSHTSQISMPISLFFGYLLIGMFAYYGGQDLFQRIYASRSEQHARRGIVYFAVFVLTITGVSIFLGMAARAINPGVVADQALPFLAANIVPAGLTGLVLAAFVSMANSTADGTLLTMSSSIIEDFIAKKKDLEPGQELLTNRILVVLVGVLGLGMAVIIPDIAELFNSIGSWFGILGVNVFASLYWEIDEPIFYSLLAGFVSANLIAVLMGNFQASGLLGILVSALVIAIHQVYVRFR